MFSIDWWPAQFSRLTAKEQTIIGTISLGIRITVHRIRQLIRSAGTASAERFLKSKPDEPGEKAGRESGDAANATGTSAPQRITGNHGPTGDWPGFSD